MSTCLQSKLLRSISKTFASNRSGWNRLGNLVERTLPNHFRPLSTTHKTDNLWIFQKHGEFKTCTVHYKKFEGSVCTFMSPFSIISKFERGSGYLETKSRQFSTSTNFLAKKAQKNKGKAKKLSLNEDEAEGIVDLKSLKNKMEDALVEMSKELATKVPLRITSGFMDNIMIQTGKVKKTPLYEIAQVKTNDESFSVEIQSDLPNATKLVASAISETGFNMQPSVKGSTITVPIPLISSDYKGSLEKVAKGISNQTKEALRKIRQKGMVDIRKNKDGQSKDLIHRIENQVQQLTDYYNEKVDMAFEKKVKEIKK